MRSTTGNKNAWYFIINISLMNTRLFTVRFCMYVCLIEMLANTTYHHDKITHTTGTNLRFPGAVVSYVLI